MKIETYLPVFEGFYNTLYEFNYHHTLDSLNQDRENKRKVIDIEIDNTQYENDIVINFCEVLKEYLKDYIKDIEFQKIISPREYNFKNDSADVIIDANIQNIKTFIYNNKEKFSDFLKQRYTSCDGFISHYSNRFEVWEEDTNNFNDLDINGHVLGSILDFIFYTLEIDDIDIYYDITEKVCEYNYIIKEIMEEITEEDLFYQFLLDKDYSKSYADYIDKAYKENNINNLNLSETILSDIIEFENIYSQGIDK